MFDKLVSDIEEYCAAQRCSTTTFGRKSVGDGKFVNRLRNGGRCWPETAQRVYQFIEQNPPKPQTKAQ